MRGRSSLVAPATEADPFGSTWRQAEAEIAAALEGNTTLTRLTISMRNQQARRSTHATRKPPPARGGSLQAHS